MRMSCSGRNSRIEYLKCNLICGGKNIRDWNLDRLLYISFIEFHRLILIIGHVDRMMVYMYSSLIVSVVYHRI